jgi:hypothetical protein
MATGRQTLYRYLQPKNEHPDIASPGRIPGNTSSGESPQNFA